MAYITTSNSKKLMTSIKQVSLDKIETEIYNKPIYFFNRKEINILKGIREFLRDPDHFRIEYYEPIEIVDTLRYIYPETKPAYHLNSECPNLHSDFINFEIPWEIQERGKEEILRFRKWFRSNNQLLLENRERFIYKMQAEFKLKEPINPKTITITNSGVDLKDNYSMEDIVNEIDEILREAAKFYNKNPEKQFIIKKFGKLTFLAYVKGDIFNNDTGLNDEDLKDFLRMYEERFKMPVKIRLIEYYRLLFNPNMSFSENLLEALNFKKCMVCFNLSPFNELDTFPITL